MKHMFIGNHNGGNMQISNGNGNVQITNGNGNIQVSGRGNSINCASSKEASSDCDEQVVQIDGVTIRVKNDKVYIFGDVSKVKLNGKTLFDQ